MIDTRIGSVELEQLAETLAPPCQIGAYTLQGLVSRTSTALVYIANGGAFGADEGIIKLTGAEYAPLLERELGLLVVCRSAEVSHVVRPVQPDLERIALDDSQVGSIAVLLLPFLDGGDLAQLIGAQATRTGRLGSSLALRVGEHVASILRELLRLPQPIVHRDVKVQNVLLPHPEAAWSELTLIDFDVSEQLDTALDDFATAPREVARRLVEDVHGFGELLFNLATGREPPLEGTPSPHSGNKAFDALVARCLMSDVDQGGYRCMADHDLWRDLEAALSVERARQLNEAGQVKQTGQTGLTEHGFDALLNRRWLAGVGALLFLGLVVAVLSKIVVA